MRLTDILTLSRIKVPLTGTDKQSVIRELVDVLAADGQIADAAKALEAVLERERTRTTGIGNALAIPHGKCSSAGKLVLAVGRTAAPVDFESIDGQPVSLVLLLVGPTDQTGLHIQALARISRLLSVDTFRRKLIDAPTAQAMHDLIAQRETQPD